MLYVSTRGQAEPTSFLDAVMAGQASDGGLFTPQFIPDVSKVMASWKDLSYQELAHRLMLYFTDDVPTDDLQQLINKSYATFEHPAISPVVKVGNLHILELFHGPTLAFKDFGLQFLGNVFSYGLEKQNRDNLNILCATSGDTGGAAIAGLRDKERINIFVLFPKGRPSRLQILQMTTLLGKSAHSLSVRGTFDDCQAIVKSIFSDSQFNQEHSLGSANSVNWGRVLAQIVYYFFAYFQVIREIGQKVIFSVPAGNFGNSLAGYIAARMGLPIELILLGNNVNDTLSKFFNTGSYQKGKVLHTLSPAIDIQVASNLERYLYYYFNGSAEKVCGFLKQFNRTGVVAVSNGGPIDKRIAACSVSDEETLSTMKAMWQENEYMLDPHTAVSVAATQKMRSDKACPVICLSTAHAAKFQETVRTALAGQTVEHPSLSRLESLPQKYTELAADKKEVMSYIESALT